MSERIHATYWLETGDDPARAAETIAGEQSSGTFVALPTETPELKARSGARVERLEILEQVSAPSLPTPRKAQAYTRCILELSWPIANLGACLPTLMATIAGNLFELRCVTGLRLLDLRLPPSFAAAYPGPAFGIEGTRRISGVHTGPLIGTIIKPSVGLSPRETAEQVRLLVEGGKLIARLARQPDLELFALAPDTLEGVVWWFTRAAITRDAAGRVDGFRLTGNRTRNVRFVRR